MNKFLRYSFIALLALVCQVSFADKIVTFDATADKSTSKTLEKDGVTITIGNGTLGNGSEYRIFKSQKITISCATYNISKIVFTCTANGTAQYGPGSFGTLDGYSYSAKSEHGQVLPLLLLLQHQTTKFVQKRLKFLLLTEVCLRKKLS